MKDAAKVHWWALLLPMLAVLIWSLNITVTRYVADYISPVSISFYRWLVAFLVLTPFILPQVWKQRMLVRRHLGQLAVLSAFGMVLHIIPLRPIWGLSMPLFQCLPFLSQCLF